MTHGGPSLAPRSLLRASVIPLTARRYPNLLPNLGPKEGRDPFPGPKHATDIIGHKWRPVRYCWAPGPNSSQTQYSLSLHLAVEMNAGENSTAFRLSLISKSLQLRPRNRTESDGLDTGGGASSFQDSTSALSQNGESHSQNAKNRRTGQSIFSLARLQPNIDPAIQAPYNNHDQVPIQTYSMSQREQTLQERERDTEEEQRRDLVQSFFFY